MRGVKQALRRRRGDQEYRPDRRHAASSAPCSGRPAAASRRFSRMIAGLEEVTEGTVFIGGVDVTQVPPAKRRIAMVFQSYALYPHMTVRAEHRLLAARRQGAEATSSRSGRARSRACCSSTSCSTASRRSSPAASASASPSAGRWSASRRSSSSTSRSPTSTPCCACRCGSSSPSSTRTSRRR